MEIKLNQEDLDYIAKLVKAEIEDELKEKLAKKQDEPKRNNQQIYNHLLKKYINHETGSISENISAQKAWAIYNHLRPIVATMVGARTIRTVTDYQKALAVSVMDNLLSTIDNELYRVRLAKECAEENRLKES